MRCTAARRPIWPSAEAEPHGQLGWNVASGELFWSEEAFRIFGHDPTTKPTVEVALARVHPEDASLVREVIERAARVRKD